MASANLNSWLPTPADAQRAPSTLTTPNPSGTSRLKTIAGIWMAVDALTVLLLAVLSFYLRRDTSIFQPGHPTGLGASEWFFLAYLCGFAIVLILISKAHGLYGSLHSLSGLHEQRLTVQSAVIASLILAGALYFSHATYISRAVVIATMASSTLLLCIRRAAWRIYVYRNYDREIGTRNVLIIGMGPSGLAIRNHLRRIRRLGYTFKGFVLTLQEIDKHRHSVHSPQKSSTVPEVLGSVDQISTLVRKHFIDELFITGACSRPTVRALIDQASELGIDARVIPDLYEGIGITSPVEYVGQFPTLPVRFRNIAVGSLLAKRFLDIVISLFAIVATMPIMLLIACAIYVDSRGPILYCAERVGRRGHSFCCWKFRTMVADADALQSKLLHLNERDGVLFKVTHDPRITRVGRLLRKYSLDELPQFFNVLLGDMSIVGPRPPVAREVTQYKLSHLRRLDVSPGITGLWQVQARQDPSFDQYISLDMFYVDNWSLWLDFKIMVRTFAVILSGTGS